MKQNSGLKNTVNNEEQLYSYVFKQPLKVNWKIVTTQDLSN